ncbi:MAG: transcriptional regulator [Thermoplasmata archaeon]|jgi:hypothetical protein|nr:transcriptional regulator [Thermoplasmata archaeon]
MSAPASGDRSHADLGRTRRERLRELLFTASDGLPLDEIEKRLEARRGTILADLEHLRLSFKHQDATLLMVPPTCLQCGFVFRLDVPKAPSKCPMCKRRTLSAPIFKAETGLA